MFGAERVGKAITRELAAEGEPHGLGILADLVATPAAEVMSLAAP